jgi:hypothetical protein
VSVAAIRCAPPSGAMETPETNGDLQVAVAGRATAVIPAFAMQ